MSDADRRDIAARLCDQSPRTCTCSTLIGGLPPSLLRDLGADCGHVRGCLLFVPSASIGTTGHTIDPNGVNHPRHYNQSAAVCAGCGKGIECIDIVRHMQFNVGSAVKYLWRADLKGAPINDLKKAAWYIADEIARRGKGAK